MQRDQKRKANFSGSDRMHFAKNVFSDPDQGRGTAASRLHGQ
jgi:hypothetical protein